MLTQVMRRLIDDIVAGIKEHFKMKTDKGETEEVTLKEVQTLAKKWSSRCVARARAQAATLCAQAATLCAQAATLCVRVCVRCWDCSAVW